MRFPKYPIYTFYRFIARHMPASVSKQSVIIDAPCGSGYVASMMAWDYPNASVIGVDINSEYIDEAVERYGKMPNVHFIHDDIHHFMVELKGHDVFLLVNSLFLLPLPVRLLERIREKMQPGGRLILIIPNTSSVNFQNFQKSNPTQNSFIQSKDEMMRTLVAVGYGLVAVEGLAYVPYIGVERKWLWKFKSLYVYAFNFINKYLGRKPSYWGFVLSKR